MFIGNINVQKKGDLTLVQQIISKWRTIWNFIRMRVQKLVAQVMFGKQKTTAQMQLQKHRRKLSYEV